jgi:hypothetical protein
MYSQFVTIILLTLCVAQGILSSPLNVQPILGGAAATDEEKANLVKINTAKDIANKNILKMDHVLQNPGKAGHQDMIDAAFGKDSSRNMDSIKKTVQDLKTGTVPIKTATSQERGTVAFNGYDTSKTPMKATHVEFTKKFHAKGTSDDARAATLVHEATHYLSDTGDYIKDGKMVAASDPHESAKTGYATGMEPKKSAKDLNKDAAFTKMRDGHKPTFGDAVPATKDMHKNAESYAQFQAMCGSAVSDAAVGLRRRAMADGDWETVAHYDYLIKRNSCGLSKNYFANKAAAKKATEAKVTGKTPATGAKSKSLLKNRVASAKFKALAGAKTLSGKKTAASSRKALSNKFRSGVTGKLSSHKFVVGKSKVGAVRRLSNGRVARPVSNVAGSRHPVSKQTSRPVAGNKHVARPAVHKPQVKSVKHAANPALKAVATIAKFALKKGKRDLEFQL